MSWIHEDIVESLRGILLVALQPDVPEILDTHTLGELGAIPADMLDIDFRVKRKFGVEISNRHIATKIKMHPELIDRITVLHLVQRIEKCLAAQVPTPVAA